MAAHPTAALELNVHIYQENSQAMNVIAHRCGNQDTQIVICAHYDAKVDAPGALDNAYGTAALLAIAQALK